MVAMRQELSELQNDQIYSMKSASGVVITANILSMSALFKYGMMLSNRLWIDFRKNAGGLVINDMNMSVST